MNGLAMCVAVALVTVSLFAGAHAAGAQPVVERQEIEVALAPASHLVTGVSTITFASGGRRVDLALAETAIVDSVTAFGKKLAYSFAKETLSFQLPAAGAGHPVAVTISFRGIFNDQVSSNPAAGEDPSYGVSGAITHEGTFLGGGSLWYPVPPQTPAHRSLRIEAPAGIEGISFGRRILRETTGAVTRSVWEEARPVGVLSLCAGPYQVEERRLGTIALYSYLYRENAALAPRYLDAAAKYIGFYSDLFGPYPFEKFAVVENFFPTGYGFPSFTLIGGSVLRLPFIIDTSFPHEIAHSWWGNGIEVDPREGNWSEGLVTYLADYLLKERRSPAEGRDYRHQLLIDYASLVTSASEFPLNAFRSRSDPASRAIGYGKGAMVFHMVRSRIGDAAFFAALRQVCHDHLYGAASWSDFVAAFSRTSGRDQSEFMNQWLLRPGGPRLALAEATSRPKQGGWTTFGTLLQAAPYFQLGVPLRLDTGGAPIMETTPVASETTRFAISSASVPKTVLLDPDAQVFRILSPAEIPATVNSVKGSTRLVGVVTEQCRATIETFKALLASLSQGGATVISEAELNRTEAGKADLLFCGTPRNRSMLPRLPGGFDVTPSGFSVDGTPYAGPDTLLFLVLSVPGSTGRIAALFEPLSEAAATQYTPKITHYGKYGYLVFAGGSNRRKGAAPTSGGGNSIELQPYRH